MKTLLVIFSIALTNVLYSQDICMVSTDFQTSETMLIFWEWPAVTAGIDSVIVYRKMPQTGGAYEKIGGTSVSEISKFTDLTVITSEENHYKISYKYTNGTESAKSPWHKPLLLDFVVGLVSWSEYEIEGQTSTSFVVEYTCYMDQNGLGNFNLEATMTNNAVLEWFDQSYSIDTNSSYMVEVELPNCSITKANINTSRSNIKKQFPNIEVGIESIALNTLQISPNPVEDILTISSADNFQRIEILDNQGKVVYAANSNEIVNKINVSFLNSGIYIIRAHSSNGGIFTNKLVKL